MNAAYLRLLADEIGESRLEDVEVPLEVAPTWHSEKFLGWCAARLVSGGTPGGRYATVIGPLQI